ncbi:hypothetical protein APD45_05610 [Acinetobacter baumannii]|uniref:hypothetical protein n=1 Tax=Acinetobacter baumannii TaxID=470 RepID=UPI0007079134|nr:hypothetical protein [Acinetobacter baumannii]KQE41346.1 hypothetical protein APD45_11955 [Acinetobacter baumannii]KQE48214.1 hypothetical protein APD45_05610 [Acinetobacter baumannii]
MVQPINYMLDVANPVQTTLQGFNGGLQLGVAYADRQRALKQAEQEQLAKQQMQQDLSNLATNPSYEGFTNVMTKYPQLSENLKRAYDTMDDGQRKNTLSLASQSYAALANNQPDIAKQVLGNAATAFENSGNKKDANTAKGYIKMIENNPSAAQVVLGSLWQTSDNEGFKTFSEQKRANEMQPYQIKDIQAKTAYTEAQTKDIPLAAEDRRTGVENQGKNIEYNNQYNYDKLGQDWKIELAKMSQQEQIEAARLRAAKNETSVQRMERLEKAQSFSNAASTAASTAKLAADLIADYKKLSDASGAGVWNAAWRNVPGSAEYDFSRRVDTLKSQAFLIGAQSLKGLGAMTEMEGKKVTDALGNLDLSQNTGQVVQQLAAIAKAANSVAQHSNRNAQNYATKGYGYSKEVVDTAKARGVSPAEMQKIANELGIH